MAVGLFQGSLRLHRGEGKLSQFLVVASPYLKRKFGRGLAPHGRVSCRGESMRVAMSPAQAEPIMAAASGAEQAFAFLQRL
jgi:hypothetical protein